MSHQSRNRQDSRRDRDNNSNMDNPPMSRLFILCARSCTESDFRDTFEKFGHIEEIWVVKDKQTGQNKGVVYIKFSKTSEAALAFEEMHGKCVGAENRSIKVMVAANRNQGSGRSSNEQEKYVRLFVLVPKNVEKADLQEDFEKYGQIESISIIRHKDTGERKGFAYIKYYKFLHAALAYEGCDSKYKAVFAEPKADRSNSSSDRGFNNGDKPFQKRGRNDYGSNSYDNPNSFQSFGNRKPLIVQQETKLDIICSSVINQDRLWRLFDIVPGLDYCQINDQHSQNAFYATAVYNSLDAALYAREKLHGLEYPPGERLIIKPIGEGRPNVDKLFAFPQIQSNSPFDNVDCTVDLPPIKELSPTNSPCVQRCFIVCVSQALPGKVLTNIFSRFGNLIEVYLLANRNCGYARYASEISARNAIETLHGCEVNGVRLKVMEAEERTETKRRRIDDDDDDNFADDKN